MKIAVIGVGHVGAVMCGCFADLGHDVVAVDLDEQKVALINRGLPPVLEPGLAEVIATARSAGRLRATRDALSAIAGAEISFVCVNTPGAPDGSAQLTQVEQAIGMIGDALRVTAAGHTVVMCSTVPPGTGEGLCIALLQARSGRRHREHFRYVASPEFLREGSAVRDFMAPPMILLGVGDESDVDVMRAAYAGVNAPFRVASYRTAESVKLLSNVYHALKVAFANEAASVLSAYDVDAREAFTHFCADDVLNISSAYLTPGFAFGGACLLKDLRGVLALADAASVATPLLSHIEASNEAIIDRAVERIVAGGRRRVALLGLTVKHGIDDLRGSPYTALAERLLRAGCELRIFDPALRSGNASRDDGLPDAQREASGLLDLLVPDAAEALAGSDVVVVAHRDAVPRVALLELITDQDIIDLQGNAGFSSPFGLAATPSRTVEAR